MPRGPRIKSRSGVYHIIQRGANKQEIFHDDQDCRKFLDILLKYKMQAELAVYAWCLMNNHVHLLLKEGNEDISITMKRIGVSYVSYYNWKYDTTGHLYQGRFKSIAVETPGELLRVTRYIHQNPVKAGMVNQADEWKWSSCAGYYNKTLYPKDLLDQKPVLNLISGDAIVAGERFREFNERKNPDPELDDKIRERKRLRDDEARMEIKKVLGSVELAMIKSLPKSQRNELLRKITTIEGLSKRQAARILGISPNLIYKV